MNLIPPAVSAVVYPESDGKPLAENTQQLRWILLLTANLGGLFRDRDDVFVSGDQLWYPVEGRPDIHLAPDVYVVFGRPRGDRPSYKQWEEGGVPMTVVFEILSPSNTYQEMADKQAFYEEYGVEEYYIYDPESNRLQAFVRHGEVLARVRRLEGFVSPRLGIRFEPTSPEMTVYGPDGRPFLPAEDLAVLARRTEQAEQRLARLIELGRKVRRGEATADEQAELEQLEG